MKSFSVTALLISFLGMFTLSTPVNAEVAPLRISEMAVTTKIVRGNPIDSVHRISSASVKALYCFTRLTATEETDTTIRHVWYRGNEKVGDYELPVKGKRWRTFSQKVIEKGGSGDWRVEAIDEEGKLLRSVKFRMN